MKSIYQPGTDGYAQAKAVRNFCIAVSVLLALSLLLFVIPSGNFLHKDFVRSSGFWKVAGIISTLGQVYVTWKILSGVMNDEKYSGPWVYWITMGWFFLNLCLLAGWNFSIG